MANPVKFSGFNFCSNWTSDIQVEKRKRTQHVRLWSLFCGVLSLECLEANEPVLQRT